MMTTTTRMLLYFGLRGDYVCSNFSFSQQVGNEGLSFLCLCMMLLCPAVHRYLCIIVIHTTSYVSFLVSIYFLMCLVQFDSNTFVLKTERKSLDESTYTLLLFCTSLSRGSKIKNQLDY